MHEQFEAAIAEDIDNNDHYLVYADWLEEQDDPLGELIRIHLELETLEDSSQEWELSQRAGEIFEENIVQWSKRWFPGFSDKDAQYHIKGYGVVKGLPSVLDFEGLNPSNAFALVDAPGSKFLRKLELSHTDCYSWDEPLKIGRRTFTHDDFAYGHLNIAKNFINVKHLKIGAYLWEDGIYHGLKETPVLVKRFPALEEIEINGPDHDLKRLFNLKLPHLKRLTVHLETDYPMEVLARNKSLANLEAINFKPAELNADDIEPRFTLETIQTLVRAKHLKNLKHFTLKVCTAGDEGVQEIVDSGLIYRLESLTLTHGQITDAGVQRILNLLPTLKLQALDFTGNALSEEMVERLESLEIDGRAYDQHDVDSTDFLYQEDLE